MLWKPEKRTVNWISLDQQQQFLWSLLSNWMVDGPVELLGFVTLLLRFISVHQVCEIVFSIFQRKRKICLCICANSLSNDNFWILEITLCFFEKSTALIIFDTFVEIRNCKKFVDVCSIYFVVWTCEHFPIFFECWNSLFEITQKDQNSAKLDNQPNFQDFWPILVGKQLLTLTTQLIWTQIMLHLFKYRSSHLHKPILHLIQHIFHLLRFLPRILLFYGSKLPRWIDIKISLIVKQIIKWKPFKLYKLLILRFEIEVVCLILIVLLPVFRLPDLINYSPDIRFIVLEHWFEFFLVLSTFWC